MGSPLIFQDQSGLAQGIAGVGGALSQALGQRMQRQRFQQQQQQYGNILQSTLGELDETASPIQVTQALSSALSQGVPSDIVNQYGTLFSTLQKTRAGLPPGPEQVTQMSNLFQKFGMPPEIAQRNAELWAQLTTGGQTEMAKLLIDEIARGQYGEGVGRSQEEVTVSEDEVKEFKFPKVDVFEDRTHKERVQLKSQLLKDNNAEYKAVSEGLKKTDNEIMRYDQLERLNESGKLPKGLGRLNINWTTGDIRVPALANPETQLFVKTINDFTVAAKDTYGARVTNFELGAFMKRLPTLANTEEGRRLIIAQMKSMKGLDRLYDESVKKAYDHYGMQKVDRQTVERVAADLRKEDEERLKKDFENSIHAQEVYEARQRSPENYFPVRKPDGNIGYLPIEKIDFAKKKGWEML
jgi:hypothetical protein